MEELFHAGDAEADLRNALTEQAIHEATHTFLDQNRALDFLKGTAAIDWELVEVPAVSPLRLRSLRKQDQREHDDGNTRGGHRAALPGYDGVVPEK